MKIEDLKRKMVIREEVNIKLYSEEEETHVSRKIPKKPSKKQRFGGCVSNNNWQFKTDNTHGRWSDTIFSDKKKIQIY